MLILYDKFTTLVDSFLKDNPTYITHVWEIKNHLLLFKCKEQAPFSIYKLILQAMKKSLAAKAPYGFFIGSAAIGEDSPLSAFYADLRVAMFTNLDKKDDQVAFIHELHLLAIKLTAKELRHYPEAQEFLPAITANKEAIANSFLYNLRN